MLSKEEWTRTAEHSAAAAYGEKHKEWYAFKRWGAAPLGVLIAVGAVGYGAFWLWERATGLLSGSGPSVDAPLGLFAAAAVLLLVTVIAFWPGRLPSTFPVLLAKLSILGVAWMLVLGFLLGSLVS